MKTLVGTRDVSEGLAFGKFSEVEYVLSATDPNRLLVALITVPYNRA